MRRQRVIIIGAGIGGLSTALALQRSGHTVQIHEAGTELGEVGAGLSISPNATAGLIHLGLEKPLAAVGHTPASFGIKHYRSGQLLVDNTREMTVENAAHAPYCMLHRADLHAMLLDAVQANDPDCLHLGHEFRDARQSASSVSARFRNGQEAHGDLLVGCDGIRSAVRANLFGAESPRFTGYIAWRGLVPVPRVPANLLPLEPESAICIGPGKTITRYLLAQRGLINYVAVAQRAGWEIESWAVRSEVAELLEEFAEFHSDIRGILAATPPENCYKWALFDRDPLARWSIGSITLAGDAAHPMLPFMGQGAVMAIEDAVILARCIDAETNIASALQRYERARRERCALVMLESRANIVRLQGSNPDSYDKAAHRNEQRLGLFDYNPATVAI